MRIVFRMTVVLLLLAASLAGCTSSPQSVKHDVTIRVMTYNIHHGEGLDRRVDLERIAQIIRRERADIVALQEVDKGAVRTGRRDMPAELARLTGMTCAFSNNFHVQGGDYGNAVLTRFPVKTWKNYHYPMIHPGEQRGLLQVELDIHGVKVAFLNTHLDYNSRNDDSARWASVADIETIARSYVGQTIILCGDFNDTPSSRVYRRLCKFFDDTWNLVGQGDGFTIPADAPTRRIDYVWVSKERSLRPVKEWVPSSDASDHRPVVAEFSLR